MKPFIRLSLVIFFVSYCAAVKGQEQNPLAETIDSIRESSLQFVKGEQLHKAIDTLQYAVQLVEDSDRDNDPLLFGLYVDLSNLYGQESVRNHVQSERYIDLAKKIIESDNLDNYTDVINFYISIAASKVEEGLQSEALGYIAKASEFYENHADELENQVGVSSAQVLKMNLLEWPLSIYLRMELEEELLLAYQELENYFHRIKSPVESHEYYALANFRVGRYYQAKDADKAVFYFNKAEQYGDRNIKLYSNICKGFALLSAKQYDAVEPIINQLESFENLNIFQKLNIHEIAGRLYSEKKDLDKLIHHTNEALTLLNQQENRVNVMDFSPEGFSPIEELKYPILLNQFAMYLESSGSEKFKNTSSQLFKIGLEQFSERIDRSPFHNQLRNYEIIKNRMLHHMVGNTASLNEKKELISHFENIENRANLNAILANRTIARDSSQLDVLIAKEQTLIEQITDLKLKQQETDSTFRSELARLDVDLLNIQSKIKAENPTIYNLNNGRFSFEKLKLEQNESIVLFDVADNELFRTVITPANIEVIKIQDFPVIEQEIQQFLMLIKNKGDLTELNDLSSALSDKLMGNIALKPVLKIKADKALLNLPFEVLIKEDEYLIQKSTISYIRGLAYLSSKIQESDRRLASNASFYAPSYSSYVPLDTEIAVRGEAYDLEGAKEEVNQLAAIVSGEIFENERASKTNFLKTANSSSIIHIAGHAFLNNGDPSLSNIVFSDDLEDNKLFISELYGLRSNADLAVLSACNTGVGGFDSGNGIISLSDAFLYSGVPSTVSSLWSAPDQSTKDIMVAFYSYLKEGEPKSKALQLAKIDYLKNVQSEKLQHPFYWSAFVLYGNDAPLDIIIENHDGSYKWWLLVVGVVVLLILTWIVFRKKSKIQ